MTTDQARKIVPDKSYVVYAGNRYLVADISYGMIGIYDEPPTGHIDYLNIKNVKYIDENK